MLIEGSGSGSISLTCGSGSRKAQKHVDPDPDPQNCCEACCSPVFFKLSNSNYNRTKMINPKEKMGVSSDWVIFRICMGW